MILGAILLSIGTVLICFSIFFYKQLDKSDDPDEI